ncbi:interferon-induced protein 44-like isoform X2 [Acipenser ruthenus]|uniref:interferon-induced protein 44-like isoform X2 n=1 Tax=Acipenser ruthenus TaxID=7906 RepID=UPI002740A3D1|nr:interferon-induced protein 44-like isoform X2 [Acipenser ruthenus]
MAWVQTREFKVYEHGGRNTEICEQFTRKIEEKGYFKVSVRTDIKSFLYVHEVTRVFHDIKSALNSAGNINSYAAVVIFRKLTPYEKPDSSDLYSTPLPLGIPNELPIVACYWFENDCKQQLCDCEENKESVKKLVRLIKRELQTDTDSGSPSSKSRWTNFWNSLIGQSSVSEKDDEPKPEPWREDEFSDDAYMKLQEEIKNHQPHPKASTTNILISGSVGSGKSSFLNSVLSELRREEFNGRVQSFQGVRPGAQTSVTQHLRCHKFIDKMKIFDTAGFELEKTENATIILKKIIDGEVAEGTKFDDILKTKSSMEGDKIHCVVMVISIHNAENLALIRVYKEFIGMLIETGVPCQLLVTFVDELFEKTVDLKNLYRRSDIKQKIENIAEKMRISMCNVLVVSNYFAGEKINQIKGTLLLEAFAQMLTAAKPFQERM